MLFANTQSSWDGSLMDSNSSGQWLAALSSSTSWKLAPQMMESIHAPKNPANLQSSTTTSDTRGRTTIRTTPRPAGSLPVTPTAQGSADLDDDEDCLNFVAEAPSEPLISISAETSHKSNQELVFMQRIFQYVIKPNWPDLLVNFADPLQQIISLCHDYALHPEKLLQIIEADNKKSKGNHGLQSLGLLASKVSQIQRAPHVETLSEEKVDNLLQIAQDSYLSKMNEAKAEIEAKAQEAAKQVKENEHVLRKEEEMRQKQHNEAMLELKRKQEQEERERKNKAEAEEKEKERLQSLKDEEERRKREEEAKLEEKRRLKEAEERRMEEKREKQRKKEEEQRIEREKAEQLKKEEEARTRAEKLKKEQEEARVKQEEEQKERELSNQRLEQEKAKQAAQQREQRQRREMEQVALRERQIQEDLQRSKEGIARANSDIEQKNKEQSQASQSQSMSRSQLGSAALSESRYSVPQNISLISQPEVKSDNKNPTNTADLETQNRMDAIRLSKERPFSLSVNINLTAILP